MGFYKTFVLPVIKERFDLDEKPVNLDEVNKEIEFVSGEVYMNGEIVKALYLTNVN